MDAGGAEDVPHLGCCILEAGLHTPQLCLGVTHLGDLVDVPAWDKHLLSPGNLKTMVALLLSYNGGEGRAKLAFVGTPRLDANPPGPRRGPQLWRQSCQ